MWAANHKIAVILWLAEIYIVGIDWNKMMDEVSTGKDSL